MKQSLALVALAAGLGQVSATGFHQAPIFSYPGNTDNKCDDKQQGGYNWGDLDLGDFTDYGGFQWGGFKCESKFSKRDELAPRTFQDKCITGNAHPDKGKSPSFKCDPSKGKEQTSIDEFYVTPEFDCDLEFHYDMPNGSTCKHRSPCKKSGTVVKNNQCGGAKGVTIVYPSQPSKPKPTCSFGFHSIKFDCNKYSTKPPKTSTKPPPQSSSTSKPVPVTTTSSTPGQPSTYVSKTPSTTSDVKPSSSKPGPSTYETKTPGTTPGTTSNVKPSTSAGPSTYETKTPGTTPGTTSDSKPSTTPGSPGSSTYETKTPGTTSDSKPSTTPGSPGSSTYETKTPGTTSNVQPSSSIPGGPPYDTKTPGTTSDVKPSTTTTPGDYTTPDVPRGSSTSSAPGPIETLPCPPVVPSCLNTFLDLVQDCKDNTDTACFCPNAEYVKTVFECIYAHGESDEIVSEAIQYFQGICASHCNENPAIVTGADTITRIITVTAPAPPVAGGYTTVYVDATTVVAVTNSENGSVVPGSSTTVVVTTTITVPQVGFATVTGDGSSSVAIVPGYAVATQTPTKTGSGGQVYPTTLITAPPTGVTTGTRPTSSVVTAGAANIRSGLGLVGLVAIAVAAL